MREVRWLICLFLYAWLGHRFLLLLDPNLRVARKKEYEGEDEEDGCDKDEGTELEDVGEGKEFVEQGGKLYVETAAE